MRTDSHGARPPGAALTQLADDMPGSDTKGCRYFIRIYIQQKSKFFRCRLSFKLLFQLLVGFTYPVG